ncbi:Protein yceI [Fibrella aestuarina BUZ 2]|uniref:Protein yceI n=1 Tax=Fibrella aestuarina BUZ 2 TaxID=1166018 RepID=I0K3H0_9BACT|nr:YceI family protein [Fibrella aestuarina]CCG98673.1 Protein yceI [Fibrella aestuarina BUZ 2]
MKLLALLLICTAFAPLAPKKLVADKAKSTVTYAMKHPMHDWEGVSRDVNAALVIDDATKQVQQVAVVVRVASFDSQNQNRDSHMVEVLDGLKYPNVTFTSQDVKTNADGSLTATGKLTFHNVTKPVTIQATRRDQNGQWQLDGQFTVKLTDYAVERPTLLAVPTDDQFKLSFSILFK